MARYVDALLAELELRAAVLEDRVETVFLGGGTPTFTEAPSSRLLEALAVAGEVTVEANPETVTPALARLASRGGDRVSLGAQSFQPELLHVLERRARRTPSGAPSTIFVMPILTTSRSTSCTGFPARAPPRSTRHRRSARARTGARLVLRARGQAGHEVRPCARGGARAPGRGDGGLLRARRRAAERGRVSLVRDGELLPRGRSRGRARPARAAQPRVLARAGLPRASGSAPCRRSAASVDATRRGSSAYVSSLARRRSAAREVEQLDDAHARRRSG